MHGDTRSDSTSSGGSRNISIPYSYTEYLQSNGNNGTGEGFTQCAIGGNTVLSKRLSDGSMFMSGIGRDTGLGGDQHSILGNDTGMNCGHTSKGNDGRGGGLYILSTEYYSVCKIDAPNNATVRVTVTGDDVPRTGNVDKNVKHITVGTLQTTGDLSFIVRKGARVNYTVSQQYYNTESGYFIAGQANGASVSSNVTVNNLNTSDNTQTVKVNLSKTIYKHTITSSGATITVTGKFTDSKGNITSYSKTGTGKVEFNVWADENNNDVNYTVSKQYYNTTSGSVNVTSNGGTTNVTLDKTKYFVQTQYITYGHAQNSGLYKWNPKGDLDKDNGDGDGNGGTYARAYFLPSFENKRNGSITVSTRTGLPNNWTMVVDGCYASSLGNPTVTVSINGKTTNINNKEMSSDKNTYYTIDGSGSTVNNIVVTFKVPKHLGTHVYLDSIYFTVRD